MSADEVPRVRVGGRKGGIPVWLRGPNDRFLLAWYDDDGLGLEEGSGTLEDGEWRMGPSGRPGVTVMTFVVSGELIVDPTLTAEGHHRKWKSAGLPVGPCCGFL